MKKISLVLVLTLASSSTFAADLPSPPGPPAYLPPPPIWTGFYAGLNAGYGWGTTNQVTTASVPLVDNLAVSPAWGTPFGFTAAANSGLASVNQSGFIGGGQLGYNYQWSSNLVAGLEADIQGSAIRGSGGYVGAAQFGPDLSGTIDTATGSGAITAGIDWMGTVRGRLGFLFSPTLLIYGTGGFAYGGVHATATHILTFTDSFPTLYPTFGGVGRTSRTLVGWTAGGGVEWMFMPNWSLKAEAVYYDLGRASFNSTAIGAVDPDGTNLNGIPGAVLFSNIPTTRVKYDGVIARAGVNYHFNWVTAPVLAKF